jgi:hypothetical protein
MMAQLRITIPVAPASRKRSFDAFDECGRSSPDCIIRARVESGQEPTPAMGCLSLTSPARKLGVNFRLDAAFVSLGDLDSIFGDFAFPPSPLPHDRDGPGSPMSMPPVPVRVVSSDLPAHFLSSNDGAAVAAFLNGEDAAWNQLIPNGQVVPAEAVVRSAMFLGLATAYTMIASLEALPWQEAGRIVASKK